MSTQAKNITLSLLFLSVLLIGLLASACIALRCMGNELLREYPSTPAAKRAALLASHRAHRITSHTDHNNR